MVETKEIVRMGKRSIVAWLDDGNWEKYVTCTDYDPSKPVGCQWCWGHYYEGKQEECLRDAMMDLLGIQRPPINPTRLMEIASKAIQYIAEEEDVDFVESEFELEPEEMKALGVERKYDVYEVDFTATIIVPHGKEIDDVLDLDGFRALDMAKGAEDCIDEELSEDEVRRRYAYATNDIDDLY